MLAQGAEGGDAREAGARESRVGLAAHQPHDHAEAEAVVDAGHARERLADEQGRLALRASSLGLIRPCPHGSIIGACS